MVAAQKLPQILQLNPASEIVFLGPFNSVVTSFLELKNPSNERVCFKVKTTAPRRYCVRPNSGVIEQGGKMKIAIMLQPMGTDSLAERNKHKFMVQSTIKSRDDESIPLDEIWSKATPDEIMDSKLRCVFHMPDPTNSTEATTEFEPKLQDETSAPDVSKASPPSYTSAIPAKTLSQQQTEQAQQTSRAFGTERSALEPTITTSTPIVSRATSSTTKSYGSSSVISKRQPDASEQKFADKSVASSHNLTISFLQPMSDDHKTVLVCLAMLFLGVILGKYII